MSTGNLAAKVNASPQSYILQHSHLWKQYSKLFLITTLLKGFRSRYKRRDETRRTVTSKVLSWPNPDLSPAYLSLQALQWPLTKSYFEFHVHEVVGNNFGIFPRLFHTVYIGWLYKYDIGFQILSSSHLNILHGEVKAHLKTETPAS